MAHMLQQVLQEYGLSEKEANLYLVCLELGNAPVSSIARRLKGNRVTVYSALKNLMKKGLVVESIQDSAKYYSVISPESLSDILQKKQDLLKRALPQFNAIANKYDNKPQVQFFEGIKGLKSIYEGIILYGGDTMEKDEPILAFVGTGDIDPAFQSYLVDEFAPWRLKFPIKTKSILAKKSDNKYIKYHATKHDSLIIDDPVFDFADEIILYGKNKVALVMYATQEMCGLIIASKTLHDCLKGMFNLMWKTHENINKLSKMKKNKS